jgi:hypothetical protein
MTLVFWPMRWALLEVVVRISVTFVDNDSVGRGQVDAETTGPGGEKEHELLGFWRIESVDGILTVIASDTSIKALILGIYFLLFL